MGNFAAVFVALAVSLLAPGINTSEPAKPQSVPMATADRVLEAKWWPTKGTPSRDSYVGSAACAKCHAEKAQGQESTPMTHAAIFAADSKLLDSQKTFSFRVDP